MAEIEVEGNVPMPTRRTAGRPMLLRDAGELVVKGNAILAAKATSKRKAANKAVEGIFAEFGFQSHEAASEWLRKKLTIGG